MLLTMLSSQVELLIPLFAIVFSLSIPILAIYWYYKHKSRVMDERKLMIEKGITPPEMVDHMAESRKKSPMSRGIDMLAVALGIIAGYFASTGLNVIPPIAIICAILFFLGIANIVKSFILKNEFESNE